MTVVMKLMFGGQRKEVGCSLHSMSAASHHIGAEQSNFHERNSMVRICAAAPVGRPADSHIVIVVDVVADVDAVDAAAAAAAVVAAEGTFEDRC